MQTKTISEAPASEIPFLETPEPEISKTHQIIARFKNEVTQLQRKIYWLEKYAEKLSRLPPISTSMYADGIDFENLSHPAVLDVIQELGGRWTKSENGDRIDYQSQIDGMVVRCWKGEPPPSCKVVEVEELVPEVPAIPASVRKVRKLVCTESKPDTDPSTP